ncbi:hypothetical protein LIER_03385 [Lithospermum erythrorhizon]|uniref:Bidirectional sugar transporter SWEET n=1 Tax=Lithospermum erythrorhizon TaxID=34254 RepID=A0AAV3NSW4_LITER
MASASFILGIIGNAISLLMFASPMKTFRRVIKTKSTESFKGLPYITTLLSTSLWTFYGLLKPNGDGLLVTTVNGAGAFLHVIYVTLFLIYAPKNVKIGLFKLVAILDIGFLGVVIGVTLLALHGNIRLTLVGLICAGLTIGMYAAPLSSMRTVIKMRSVEYMPFWLSFFQFVNGGTWLVYALLIKDLYIAVPNGLGFILGSVQLALYGMYRNKSPSLFESKSIENGGGEKEIYDSKGEKGNNNEMKDINEKPIISEGGGGLIKKGTSLPKPSIAREYSQKLVKTLSMSQYAMSFYNEYNYNSFDDGDNEGRGSI